MAYSTWNFKRGDNNCIARTQLVDENNAPVAISGAVVRFHMGVRGQAASVDSVATIITAATGIVQYSLTSGNLSVAGTFDAEWQVTFANGDIQTFPSDRNDVIKITEQVA